MSSAESHFRQLGGALPLIPCASGDVCMRMGMRTPYVVFSVPCLSVTYRLEDELDP